MTRSQFLMQFLSQRVNTLASGCPSIKVNQFLIACKCKSFFKFSIYVLCQQKLSFLFQLFIYKYKQNFRALELFSRDSLAWKAHSTWQQWPSVGLGWSCRPLSPSSVDTAVFSMSYCSTVCTLDSKLQFVLHLINTFTTVSQLLYLIYTLPVSIMATRRRERVVVIVDWRQTAFPKT